MTTSNENMMVDLLEHIHIQLVNLNAKVQPMPYHLVDKRLERDSFTTERLPIDLEKRAEIAATIERLNELVVGFGTPYYRVSSPLLTKLRDLGFLTTSAAKRV